MKIILIDNYDSFTYNLFQLLGSFDETEIEVYRNDEITIEGLSQINPDCIILSPGPGNPNNDRDFGICSDTISMLGKYIPILGVCLGHQGIALLNGARISNADRILHGKTSQIIHDGRGIFANIPKRISVARYHSLIVSTESLPVELQMSAETDDGELMAFRHRDFPLFGIQFHPESFMTEFGKEIIANFIRMVKLHNSPVLLKSD